MMKLRANLKSNTSDTFAGSGVLQRKCACGNHTVAGGECEACRKKRLQQAARSSQPAGDVPPIVHDVLRSPGTPLDASTRAFVEPRFGHDFSGAALSATARGQTQAKLLLNQPGDVHEQEADRAAERVTSKGDMQLATEAPRYNFSGVRVHTDQRAAESARAVRALAYTVGRNVVFGAGQYAPGTAAGKRLLVHELAHTIQQGAISYPYGSAGLMSLNALQRKADDEGPTVQPTEAAMSGEEFLPEPADEENFVVGNSMDLVSGDSPVESVLAGSTNLPKAPEEKGKTKMGGPLGPVKEGMGQPKANLPSECKEWIKLKRTTYAYDPAKGADPLETEFLEKYKDFKEGIPITKPGDFNTKLKAATANPCTCIENLNVDGHGGSWSGGAQEFAPRKFKTLGERSFGVKKDKDGNLVPYNFEVFDGITFCKPCAILLGGCYVALNTPKAEAGPAGFKGAGDALGKALAAKTGCSVTAYTDLTTTPKAGEFKGGGAGKWVTTKPEKSGK
jgi:uncharacterized protein DUF4157